MMGERLDGLPSEEEIEKLMQTLKEAERRGPREDRTCLFSERDVSVGEEYTPEDTE